MKRPFAEAAEQNRQVIFDVIKPYLKGDALEIGSGTGQHAVFFAAQVAELRWQCTDLAQSLPGIDAWIEESALANLRPSLLLDVEDEWPDYQYDLVYSANCLHIMSAAAVISCIKGVANCLKPGGVFIVYGPFNYGGQYTAESNARFDQFLKSRDPASGIRDFEWLDELAINAGLELLDDVGMPVDNHVLVWQKRTL